MSYKMVQSNNNYILEMKNTKTYYIEDACVKLFISSIQHVVGNSLKNNEGTKIIFHASNVVTLADVLAKRHLTYDEALVMVGFLTKQLMFLNERNVTILGFDLKDILVLNDVSLFFIASPMNVKGISGKKIDFDLPFYKPEFVSPLVADVSSIPSSVSCFVDRYSLAIVVIYAIGMSNMNLDLIKNTKLYWFLKRCLDHYEGRLFLI